MSNVRLTVDVNGENRTEEIEPRTLLVHFLRDHLGLTGTHIGCDTSNCGACTVLLDGKAVKSCTVLALQTQGKKVVTIEGISEDGTHPIQEAFVERFGLQCGYCTPGMIMTSLWLLNEKQYPTEDEIKNALGGNLCRCTGYRSIIDSVMLAAEKMHGSRKGR
ncbi:MAG: (2Fe-2S)-binding protein [Thermoplasmata archaeon]|nr:(2Fe-2S)-binding protein [Candidatus Sysuiplasma acidicola]